MITADLDPKRRLQPFIFKTFISIWFSIMMDDGHKIIDNIIYSINYDHQPDVRGIGWVYYESMLKNKDRLAQITLAFLNTTELMTLFNTPKPSNIDTSALQLIITGGGPISKVLIEKTQQLFPGVLVRINYGLSEVFSNTLSFNVGNPKHVELMERKKNSCGLPKIGISYKVNHHLI
ncbi:hypothetical protein FQR65_LT04869 [Abscondita terminalis]|nr:hypothetical protein FQR65_LT04869 [Abscondita terminalis]